VPIGRLLIGSGFLLLAGLGLVSAQTEKPGVRIITPSDIQTAHFIATETETVVQVQGVGPVRMILVNTRRQRQ
jgi:hypothetical protein